MDQKIKVIAYYLPQFHPIPENNKWWGKGFTEWTNVGKAKPLFSGHYQPRVPADLGYYDLRVPEVREAQANLARQYGIKGFCYWHYWFGNGKRLLERPFNEVLASGKPDFPFCLAWANESWKGLDHGLTNRKILIEQLYAGDYDYKAHFYSVLPAFKDKRYIKVSGKPIFVIYRPLLSPEISRFISTWRKLSLENGLDGIYFVGHTNDSRMPLAPIYEAGFDAITVVRITDYYLENLGLIQKGMALLNRKLKLKPLTLSYCKASKYFVSEQIDTAETVFPSLIPGWDHTPRSGMDGLVLTNSTPELFKKHVENVIEIIKNKQYENKIVFLKSWNEWAEGNYIEPDLKYGLGFLEALKQAITG